MEVPKPTASDAPKESISAIFGLCFSSPSLISGLHMTPDEIMINTEEISKRPGSSSRTLSIGRANASPTIAMEVTS